VSQDTLATLLDLYANPTDNLSNSSLSNRASQFLTDYMMLAPERLFLKTASATQREQDVWVYSFEQPLAGAPDFFGGKHIDFGSVPPFILIHIQHSTPLTSTILISGSPSRLFSIAIANARLLHLFRE
jgi:hypothetical protein